MYLLLAVVGLIWCALLISAMFLVREGFRLLFGSKSEHFLLSKWVPVEKELAFSKHLGRFVIALGVYLLGVCALIVVFQLPLKTWTALVVPLVGAATFGRKWLDKKAKE